MLRDLGVRINQIELETLIQQYNLWIFQPPAVSKLFRRNLKSLSTVKFVKIGIVLTSIRDNDGKHEVFGNQVDVYKHCEFDKLYNDHLEKYVRKKYLLSLIRDCLLDNTTLLGISTTDINDAYEECLKRKILWEYFYKNKLFRAPSRKYHFGLLIIHDVDKYEIWEVLFNGKKEEIGRRKSYHDRNDYYFLESASWENDKDAFCYKFDCVEKLFSSSVEDILNGEPSEVLVNRDKYFK
jgi:hypothetical protein